MVQHLDPLPFEIDHVVARKHGGLTTPDNLALSCFACNNHRGSNMAGLEPETGDLVPLFHPRRDTWHERFRWEGAMLVGQTGIWGATVEVLGINLPHRRCPRGALMAEEAFPPPAD